MNIRVSICVRVFVSEPVRNRTLENCRHPTSKPGRDLERHWGERRKEEGLDRRHKDTSLPLVVGRAPQLSAHLTREVVTVGSSLISTPSRPRIVPSLPFPTPSLPSSAGRKSALSKTGAEDHRQGEGDSGRKCRRGGRHEDPMKNSYPRHLELDPTPEDHPPPHVS